jgi:hypothetical protein
LLFACTRNTASALCHGFKCFLLFLPVPGCTFPRQLNRFCTAGTHKAHDTAFYKHPSSSSSGDKLSAIDNAPKVQGSNSFSWIQRLVRSEPGAAADVNSNTETGAGLGHNNGAGIGAKNARNSTSSGFSHVSGATQHTQKSFGSKQSLPTTESSAGRSDNTRNSAATSGSKKSAGGSSSSSTSSKGKTDAQRCKLAKGLLLIVPLMLLVTALGIGSWAWAYVITNKQGDAPAAAVVNGSSLLFKVTVAVPTMGTTTGCSGWFGTAQVRQ